MLTRKIILSALLALACQAAHATNPYVTATYRPLASGYRVEFTVHNTVTGNTIGMWNASTSDGWDVSQPLGWDMSQDFREVRWHTDVIGRDIPSGGSLGGFGFTTQSIPAAIGWWILADTGYAGSVTPQLAPEPSALLALVGGLGALGLPMLCRRK